MVQTHEHLTDQAKEVVRERAVFPGCAHPQQGRKDWLSLERDSADGLIPLSSCGCESLWHIEDGAIQRFKSQNDKHNDEFRV